MARTISAFEADSGSPQDLRVTPRGDLEIVSAREDVRQRVIERLRFWFGQWFLRVQEGIPYRNEVFTRPISAGLAATLVTEQIRAVEGVTGVSGVTARIDPRTGGSSTRRPSTRRDGPVAVGV